MPITSGSNMILYNSSVSSSNVYGGSTNCSFSSSSSLVEITTGATGNYKEFLPTNLEFEISADGFITRDNFDYKDLLDAQIARTLLNVKFQIVNSDGTVTISCNVYVVGVDIGAPLESPGTYSVTLKGTGALSFV